MTPEMEQHLKSLPNLSKKKIILNNFILEPEYPAVCCGDEWFTEELAQRDTS